MNLIWSIDFLIGTSGEDEASDGLKNIHNLIIKFTQLPSREAGSLTIGRQRLQHCLTATFTRKLAA